MLSLTLFVLGLATAVVADGPSNFKLADKWVPVIENTEGNLWLQNTGWTLTAEPGSKIKLFCTDFRTRPGATAEETCALGKLVLHDGISQATYCGTQYDFLVYGNSSKLDIDFFTDSRGPPGYLKCVAKAVQPPKTYEIIDLSPESGFKKISFPGTLGEDNDRAWKIRSTNGDKISLQCKRRMERALGTGVCARDILTIDTGSGSKVSCGSDPVTDESIDFEITMRVETFPGTNAHVDCIVQIPSRPDAEVAPEEDSDEHGISPGVKSTTCPCGKANRDSGRIINGTEVKHESKYPFMVSLRWPDGGHFCGASILTPTHILTAAHCVSDRWSKDAPDPAAVVPTVGTHDTWKDASHGETQKLVVKEIHIPQQWFAVNGSLAGDIAILVLKEPMRYSKWVSPVCLTPTQPDVVNKYIRMMGWGLTEDGTPDILREANALVLNNKVCNNNDKEVCFQSQPSASCFGDSGGPYVHRDPETNRYTQIALVSYGFGKCDGRFYIGTNTAYWYDWIQQTINATSQGQDICQKVK